MQCGLCYQDTRQVFLDLGQQPLANKYPTEAQKPQEPRYAMQPTFCTTCWCVQLDSEVPRQVFFEDYYYLSSVNPGLVRHFESLAKTLATAKLVVDIGSNDGVLLKPLKALGVRAVGVEPSRNVSQIALDAGLPTIVDFFNAQSAAQVRTDYGQPDVIVASSIFTHLDAPHTFLDDACQLLTPDGRLIIEVEYVGAIIQTGQFERFYFDRIYYYSLASLRQLAEQHGFTLTDAEFIATHGTSVRATFTKNSTITKVSPKVLKLLADEAAILNIHRLNAFTKQAQHEAAALKHLLITLKHQGYKVAGYGAPARVATITNFAGIDTEHLRYIVDDSPLKQHRFSPGQHIPIVPHTHLQTEPCDTLLVFAWEYFHDIKSKTPGNYRYFFPIPAKEVF
jgi:methylation protein EvaC